MNKGFELYEIFDLNERHGENNLSLSLFVIDNLKSTLLLIVPGLPLFCLFMFLIEIGGDFFLILLLILSVGLLVTYKFVYSNFICKWVNNFEELSENLPGLPNLRKEIQEMTDKINFPLKNIY